MSYQDIPPEYFYCLLAGVLTWPVLRTLYYMCLMLEELVSSVVESLVRGVLQEKRFELSRTPTGSLSYTVEWGSLFHWSDTVNKRLREIEARLPQKNEEQGE